MADYRAGSTTASFEKAVKDFADSFDNAIKQTPGLRVLARVWESSRAYDIAAITPRGDSILVRFVDTDAAEDRQALRTMIAQGPFTRALLVSRQTGELSLGDIPCCRADQIEDAWLQLVSEAR